MSFIELRDTKLIFKFGKMLLNIAWSMSIGGIVRRTCCSPGLAVVQLVISCQTEVCQRSCQRSPCGCSFQTLMMTSSHMTMYWLVLSRTARFPMLFRWFDSGQQSQTSLIFSAIKTMQEVQKNKQTKNNHNWINFVVAHLMSKFLP